MLKWGHSQYKRPHDQIFLSQELSWLYFIADIFWFPFLHRAPGFLCLETETLDPLIHNSFLSEETGWFCRSCYSKSSGLWPVFTMALCQPVQMHVLERRGLNCYQSSNQEKKWCELSTQLRKIWLYLKKNSYYQIRGPNKGKNIGILPTCSRDPVYRNMHSAPS